MDEVLEVAAGPTGCPVRIGRNRLASLAEQLAGRPFRLIADRHVLALHGERLPASLRCDAIELPRGEEAKSWDVLGELLERLVAEGLDRTATLVSFGGGAACDLVGLAAALFLRGVDVAHVPTTLLAQVDASVGGKTAVNLRGGKNLAGRIHAPRSVWCDPSFLSTLSDDEWASGLGEVVKSALLSGEEDLAHLEGAAERLLDRDLATCTEVIARCVRHKARVVDADEQERGEREHLNLGHTFGHAIEHLAGFGSIPHGVAVAAGIGEALRASAAFELLADPALPGRYARLATELGLPADLAALRRRRGVPELDAERLVAAMGTDKKARAGTVRFVGLVRAGEPRSGLAWDPGAVAELLGRAG